MEERRRRFLEAIRPLQHEIQEVLTRNIDALMPTEEDIAEQDLPEPAGGPYVVSAWGMVLVIDDLAQADEEGWNLLIGAETQKDYVTTGLLYKGLFE